MLNQITPNIPTSLDPLDVPLEEPFRVTYKPDGRGVWWGRPARILELDGPARWATLAETLLMREILRQNAAQPETQVDPDPSIGEALQALFQLGPPNWLPVYPDGPAAEGVL